MGFDFYIFINFSWDHSRLRVNNSIPSPFISHIRSFTAIIFSFKINFTLYFVVGIIQSPLSD